jgi:uncharacterized protein YegJ (DUF2314 family)
MYRGALAARRAASDFHTTDLDWCEHASIDVVTFERGGVLVVLNTGPEAQPLDEQLVRGRTIIASSLHGHTDPSVVPSDTTLWLR